MELDDKALEFLINKGHDPTMGARPLKRTIQRYLEDPLAEELLAGHIKKGIPIRVSVKDENHLAFIQSAKVSA